jgi:hypothetical protein
MDTNDRAALLQETGLGVLVLGLVATLAGQPDGAGQLTNEAGEVIATPTVDPNVRTGLVIAGLAVLLLWAGYKMVTPVTDATGTETPAQ